jgi:hypothetical protein
VDPLDGLAAPSAGPRQLRSIDGWMPKPAATWMSGRPLDASNDTASRLKSYVNERRVLFVIITPRPLRSLYEVSTEPGEDHFVSGIKSSLSAIPRHHTAPNA